MRPIVVLLACLLVCAVPAPLSAASSPVTSGQWVLPCGLRISGEDASAYRGLRCLAGRAVGVSARAMRVQPAHGPIRGFRFTDETRFETNSGEGALNGLVLQDRVCVAYTSSRRILTARIVAFSPRSNPCTSGTRSTSGPGDGGGD